MKKDEVSEKLCQIIELAEDTRDILDEIEEPKEDNTFDNVAGWLTAIARMYSKSDTLEIDIYDFVKRYDNGESKEIVIDRIFFEIDKIQQRKGKKNYNLRKRIWE
jgi:hypothetical protein